MAKIKIVTNQKLITDANGMYHLLLKITNICNNRFYICKHSTMDPYDNYMGSNAELKEDIRMYGKSMFVKEIVMSLESDDLLTVWEKSYVDERLVKRRDCYNRNIGGAGRKPMYPSDKDYKDILRKHKEKLERQLKQKKNVKKEIKRSTECNDTEIKLYQCQHRFFACCNKIFLKCISILNSILQVIYTII